jgi:polyisoprenoid-binding protein YceI
MATQQGQTATRTTWEIDPAHTLIEFSARHMMVTTVKGRFTGIRGTITLDESNPAQSSVEAEIDAKTLQTGAEQRDQHLQSPDFLEVEKYPTITFRSTKVEVEGRERAKVHGDLTVHGVTKEVVLDTELTGFNRNPWGKDVVGFEARTQINRKDFGLHWNVALETGGVLVGDTIRIEVAVEAVKQS